MTQLWSDLYTRSMMSLQRVACFLAVALAVVGRHSPCGAVMAFDSPRTLASNAATDAPADGDLSDIYPAMAGDGNGNWVAVWSTSDPGAGVVSDQRGQDAVYARSTDDGRSWSPVAALSPDAATSDGLAATVASNGAGTWIAAIQSSVRGIELVRSTDAGATWSAPIAMSDLATDVDEYRAITVAGDASGRWMAVWEFDHEVFPQFASSHSEDDGLTWSTPTTVYASIGSSYPRLVTDGAGTWILTWLHIRQILASISHDAGRTWDITFVVGECFQGDAAKPDIATDGAGNWMIVWETSTHLAGELDTRKDLDITAVFSHDGGQSWEPPIPLLDAEALAEVGQRVTAKVQYRDGVWQVVWTQAMDTLRSTIGQEGDLVGVRSLDGGVTWNDPFALNVNAGRDRNVNIWAAPFPWRDLDFLPVLAAGANGTSLMVWTSTNDTDGVLGSDYDVFFARSHDDCPAAPRDGCRVPTQPGAARISIQNPAGGRDRLLWTWTSGQETLRPAFGDPLSNTSYALCLYDRVGDEIRNVFEADASADARCGTGRCWSSTDAGFKYRDAKADAGPISRVTLTAGGEGRARASVKARGPSLGLPAMPFAVSPSLLVQLIDTQNDECWQAEFSAPDSNTGELFRASSD